MTDYPARSRHLSTSFRLSQPRRSTPRSAAVVRVCLASVFLVAVVFSGCAERKRPSLPWQTASIVHPRIPEISATDSDVAEEEAPELRLDLSPPEVNFPLVPIARPLRPRVPTPQAAPVEPSKTQSPFVAPQLSAEESSTAQQQTMNSVAVAEKGLAAAQGKSLSPSQSDMASKITGFIADARAAGATGDWTGAQTLARKAQLLAEELVKSFQ
jgi:hypothetical protein